MGAHGVGAGAQIASQTMLSSHRSALFGKRLGFGAGFRGSVSIARSLPEVGLAMQGVDAAAPQHIESKSAAPASGPGASSSGGKAKAKAKAARKPGKFAASAAGRSAKRKFAATGAAGDFSE